MDDFTHEFVPLDFDPRWVRLLQRIKDQFGKKPTLESLLFLIGMNEVGKLQEKYTKEQKQELMHVAVCRLLSYNGYYVQIATDADGWPHYEQLRSMEDMDIEQQETLLKTNIIRYFDELDKAVL